MAVDFSAKINDKKAQVIAARLLERFPEGSVSADSLGNVCAYLHEYAGLDYISSMRILSHISFTGKSSDMLRLAYALIHYEPGGVGYDSSRARIVAHAKVVSVTADRVDAANPRVCLRALLVSSAHAGCFVDYEAGIRDIVRLQKKVYCGRSKALSGRSLLEFVGSVCTLHMVGDAVQFIDATAEEKQINKKLCTLRAKADTECVKAATCALCKERRNTCKLAVRY